MEFIRRYLMLFCLAIICQQVCGQALPQLYSTSFGSKSNPAIIFLHGGPGYNAFSFEASTGKRLADEGYYVIVYDQRGCGRSAEPDGTRYDFAEAVQDLSDIYTNYGIEKATLIGHSWGGTLGIIFTSLQPGKVNALVLTGSPLDYQQTFKSIIARCKNIYTDKGKSNELKYITMLEEMDTTTLDYATYCFMHAMSAGLYQAKQPAEGSKDIYKAMMPMLDARYLTNMTQPPVKGFYEQEHYTTLKLYDKIASIKKKVPVYGLYGSEDGLFDTVQLDKIKTTVGAANYTLVDNASHNVFIDQQDVFIEKLKEFLGK
jgi:proline iminopeptidase